MEDEIRHIKELLAENFKLNQENNKILRNMRKWGRIAFWTKVAVWTVVLILPILLLPYLSPLLNLLPGGLGGGTTSTSTSLFGLPSPAVIQQIIHPGS